MCGRKEGQLIGQFLIESMLIAVVAFFLALGVVSFSAAFIQPAIGQDDQRRHLCQHGLSLLAVDACAGHGLLAGVYPALVLSSFKPVIVLKGHFSSGSRGVVLRKALVVAQYTISISLIVSTLVVYSQLNFMEHQPLGFDKDQVLVITNNGDSS
jgi:putative ABC transport system permease protein